MYAAQIWTHVAYQKLLNVKGYFLPRFSDPDDAPSPAQQTPIIYKADNKMLSNKKMFIYIYLYKQADWKQDQESESEGSGEEKKKDRVDRLN